MQLCNNVTVGRRGHVSIPGARLQWPTGRAKEVEIFPVIETGEEQAIVDLPTPDVCASPITF